MSLVSCRLSLRAPPSEPLSFTALLPAGRLRCPFSTPIPETICFDSTGTPVDWFFTSKRDGGVKRKLTRCGSGGRVLISNEQAKGGVCIEGYNSQRSYFLFINHSYPGREAMFGD